MTPKEAESKILKDGWRLVKIEGSHHHYKHATKPGKVTIPFHSQPKDLDKKTIKSIFKQAGIVI